MYDTNGVHPHHVDPDNVDYQVQNIAIFFNEGIFGVREVGLDFTSGATVNLNSS